MTTVTAENLCVNPQAEKCWFCATGSADLSQAHRRREKHQGEPVCDPCANLLHGFLAWLHR